MSVSGRGPPYKPGPAVRGRVIVSTYRGTPYARKWPPSIPTKPGSPRQRTAHMFGAANRAAKITVAEVTGPMWEVTRGTPLLPRDLLIAFIYGRAAAVKMQDGTMIWSMAARTDVSDSLDVLGSTPGMTLHRGANFWEARQYGVGTPRAYLWRGTDLAGVNFSGGAAVPLGTIRYDIGGWINLGVNPSAIIVPAGIGAARFYASLYCTLVTNNLGANFRLVLTRAGTPQEIAWTMGRSDFGIFWANLTTPPIPVEEGDTVHAVFHIPGDASVTVVAQANYVAAEAAEGN